MDLVRKIPELVAPRHVAFVEFQFFALAHTHEEVPMERACADYHQCNIGEPDLCNPTDLKRLGITEIRVDQKPDGHGNQNQHHTF